MSTWIKDDIFIDNSQAPSSKGTIEFNNQVNALAKNYKDNIQKKS